MIHTQLHTTEQQQATTTVAEHDINSKPQNVLTPAFDVHTSVVRAGLVPFSSSRSSAFAETASACTRVCTVRLQGIGRLLSLADTRRRLCREAASTAWRGCRSRITHSASALVTLAFVEFAPLPTVEANVEKRDGREEWKHRQRLGGKYDIILTITGYNK